MTHGHVNFNVLNWSFPSKSVLSSVFFMLANDGLSSQPEIWEFSWIIPSHSLFSFYKWPSSSIVCCFTIFPHPLFFIIPTATMLAAPDLTFSHFYCNKNIPRSYPAFRLIPSNMKLPEWASWNVVMFIMNSTSLAKHTKTFVICYCWTKLLASLERQSVFDTAVLFPPPGKPFQSLFKKLLFILHCSGNYGSSC